MLVFLLCVGNKEISWAHCLMTQCGALCMLSRADAFASCTFMASSPAGDVRFGASIFPAKWMRRTERPKAAFDEPRRRLDGSLRFLYTHLEQLLTPASPDRKAGTKAADTLHEIADKIHKRSLVIIFSDMFDNEMDGSAIFSALQHLKHNRHEVILFHVTDKSKEIEFSFENRPYRMIDMESGEQIKVLPSEVREKYIQQVSRFNKELKLKCGRYAIDYIDADINSGFEQVLLPYLLKREKLY